MNHHGGSDHRLETAATSAVDLQTRNVNRQARVESDPTPDAWNLGISVRLCNTYIFDAIWVNARALDDRFDDDGGEVLDGNRPQGAAERTYRCPYR